MSLFRRKIIVPAHELPAHQQLMRTLSWPHLLALGVGAIVGTGILTLIGVGADRAGPTVLLSFGDDACVCKRLHLITMRCLARLSRGSSGRSRCSGVFIYSIACPRRLSFIS